MAPYPKTVYVNDQIEAEIKAAVGFDKRVYFFAQNKSANDIYINQGTHANVRQGTTLAGGLFYERDRAVPQGQIYISGSVASPALQEVSIEEEFT
jgi:predicted deacylase